MDTITSTNTVQGTSINSDVLKDLLNGAVITAHTKPDLRALNSVALRVTGGILRVSSTDRYRLLIGEVTAPEEDLIDQIIIPLTDVKKILASIKALPKGSKSTVILSRYGDLLKVLIGSDTLSVELINDNFPPVDHLFTDDKGAVDTIQLNADYLAAFAKVPTSGGGQTFTFTGDRKPIRVKINHDVIKWHGLLMPMRTN